MPHNGNEAVDNIFGATCNKIHDYDQKIEKHSILFLKNHIRIGKIILLSTTQKDKTLYSLYKISL